MFSRILFSTVAAASIAGASPALAQDAADSGRELHASAMTDAARGDAYPCSDPAAMKARPDSPAAAPSERQGAAREEAAEATVFGPTGPELNTFGGA